VSLRPAPPDVEENEPRTQGNVSTRVLCIWRVHDRVNDNQLHRGRIECFSNLSRKRLVNLYVYLKRPAPFVTVVASILRVVDES